MRFRVFPRGVPPAKRICDLVLTIPGLIVLSPILLLTSLSVWIFLGRPIVFKQKRPGYKGQIFMLYKFRTMREQKDKNGIPLPDARRLTPFGKFLRSFSLDELPELFNIFLGEMSLVGPRPLLEVYLQRYSPEQARRHDVLPGMTGWAQINGRNVLTWEDKFRLDVWYVDHWSLWLDIKILAKTVWKVISREGINPPGETTVKEFMGSQQE